MKTESYTGTMENAYGQTLAAPVKFNGTYEAFESYEELEKAGEIPKGSEIVDFVNSKRKANARQKSMVAALEAAGISKPDPNSPEQIRKNLIAGFVKSGVSEEIATRQVDALLKQATTV